TLNELEGINVNARGHVEDAGDFREYEHKGEKRKFFSFSISDGKSSCRVVMWGNIDRGKGLFPGAEVKIENALVKNSELHMNSASRLLVKRKKAGVGGKVEDIGVAEGKLFVILNGERREFGREEALKVLNVKVADDIKLETVVELKKSDLIGKEMFIEIKEGKIMGVSVRT
ncbi:MAG: hypothetical protein PHS02_01455, partial [Candidatus ainarchaeum sp.]|nr:hypothetical protein [Candidatus ainarchaeum sp.]